MRLSTVVVVVLKSNHGKYSACIHFIQTENLQSVRISGNINVYSALNFSFENWLFASLHDLYSTMLFPNNTRHFSHLFTLIKKNCDSETFATSQKCTNSIILIWLSRTLRPFYFCHLSASNNISINESAIFKWLLQRFPI